MTTPTRPNFFLLLELDPHAEWDQARFEKTLREKIKQWNRDSQGVAKKALAAQARRSLVPKIQAVMNDPVLRTQEAEEAQKELEAIHREEYEQFETQLAFLNAKETVEQDEVTRFISEFKHIISPEEIKKRVTVPIAIITTADAQARQSLNSSLARTISDRLQILGLKTLYELLDQPSQAETAEIFQAAEKLYTQSVRLHPTAEVTAKVELAGLAMEVFKTDAMRARYNETLRETTLYEILKELEDSVNRTKNKEVHPKQVLLYLEHAERAGWDETEANDKLKTYAHARKWILTLPGTETDAQKIQCPKCTRWNKKNQLYCSFCQQALLIECPRCAQTVASDLVTCNHCGFNIAARTEVDHLLNDIAHLLKEDDLQQAEMLLKTATKLWVTGKQDARTRLLNTYTQEIQHHQDRQKQTRNSVLQQLRPLMQQRRFLAAKHLIETKGQQISRREKFQQPIDTAIEQARKLLQRAQNPYENESNRAQYCQQALLVCTDLQEARNLLKTLPPAPPRKLQVHRQDQTLVLNWKDAPRAGIHYKIIRKTFSQLTNPHDGQEIAQTTEQTYTDTEPETNIPLYYAVYAVIDEVISARPALLSEAAILAEDVTDFKVVVDKRNFVLSWKNPAHVESIIITRTVDAPPSAIDDGQLIAECPPDHNSYIDQVKITNSLYYYGIYCRFKGPEGKSTLSAGRIAVASLNRPAVFPLPLTIKTDKQEQPEHIYLTWPAASSGQVYILKSEHDLHYNAQLLLAEQVEGLGELRETQNNTLQDTWRAQAEYYYTPVIMWQAQSQRLAYVGESQRYICIKDITNLKYWNLQNSIRLQWRWPVDCQGAYVVYSTKPGIRPSPNAANMHTDYISRMEYERRGYYEIPGQQKRTYEILIAAIEQHNGQLLIAQGVRITDLLHKVIVTYEIQTLNLFRKKHILQITCEPASPLPEMLLVGRAGALPLHKTDGELLLRVGTSVDERSEAQFELPATRSHSDIWGKLFLADDTLYKYIVIQHPQESRLRLH